jgi:hypothetical protein
MNTSATRTVVLLACLLVGLSARSAQAQSLTEIGGRLGVSGDPTQFYIGGHGDFGPVIDKLSFRPNLELGVGDNVTELGFNFEFAYKIPVPNRPVTAYIGAGPALVIAHTTNNTDTGGGFNILFGAQHSNGLFSEIKFGIHASPTFKFGIGYSWKH